MVRMGYVAAAACILGGIGVAALVGTTLADSRPGVIKKGTPIAIDIKLFGRPYRVEAIVDQDFQYAVRTTKDDKEEH